MFMHVWALRGPGSVTGIHRLPAEWIDGRTDRPMDGRADIADSFTEMHNVADTLLTERRRA